MENKEHFKLISAGEFVKAVFPGATVIVIATFLGLPALHYVKWLIGGSGPFVMFPTPFDFQFYCAFVILTLILEFRAYSNLYQRMQSKPFLTIKEEGIYLNKEMLPFPKFIGGSGKIELKWSNIQSIQRKQNFLVISYHEKRKERSKRVDLRWVREKEKLIMTLRDRCKDHDIEWTPLGGHWEDNSDRDGIEASVDDDDMIQM